MPRERARHRVARDAADARARGRANMSYDVIVPRATKLALVRFPGYVDDARRCEEALGGCEALTRACFPREGARRRRAMRERSKESGDDVREDASDGLGRGRGDLEAMKTGAGHGRLELNFRAVDGDGDRGASVVYGERRETRSIVLKMTEYRDVDAEDGTTTTEVEAVGLAKRVFLFRGAADFQTCASVSGRARGAIDGLKEMKGPSNDPFDLGQEWEANARAMGEMSLRPPLRTRDDIPVDDYFEQRDSGATTTREVDFHELAVPSRGMEVEDAPEEALRAMRALMEERDVWAPLAALARVPKPTANDIVARKLHAMTCYQFSSGPFKRLWIKVGVDPRFNAAHALDQTVTVRLPGSWFREGDAECVKRKERFTLSSRSDREYHDATHAFRTVPDVRHPVLFLRDVALPSVRAAAELAASSSSPAACDERLGWFTSGAFRKIQRAILRGYQTLMNGGDPIATDEAAMDAVDDDRSVDDDASLAPTDSAADAADAEYRILGPDASDADSDSDDAYDE